MTPKERATALWESWLADMVEDDQRMRADVSSAIRAAEEEAVRHIREDMPTPEGVCVCGHDAADHCEPGCCGASCRFPVDDADLDKPFCRCRHFRSHSSAPGGER